jgi:hypothetical protein
MEIGFGGCPSVIYEAIRLSTFVFLMRYVMVVIAKLLVVLKEIKGCVMFV